MFFADAYYAMKGDFKAETMEIDSGGETFALDNKPSSARDLLSAARRLVDQGQPSQALHAVHLLLPLPFLPFLSFVDLLLF